MRTVQVAFHAADTDINLPDSCAAGRPWLLLVSLLSPIFKTDSLSKNNEMTDYF